MTKHAPRATAARLAPTSIEHRILLVRGVRVMLDADLAALYGVPTKALNQGVNRNPSRFPRDFAFRLTRDEAANLRSQFVTSSSHGGGRYAPRVFTEQGVAMLSSVLKSRRAVDVNVELERNYDGKFAVVFDAIRELMASPAVPDTPRPRIGFTTAGGTRVRAESQT